MMLGLLCTILNWKAFSLRKRIGIEKNLLSNFLRFPSVWMGKVQFFWVKTVPKIFSKHIWMSIIDPLCKIHFSPNTQANWQPNIFWTLFIRVNNFLKLRKIRRGPCKFQINFFYFGNMSVSTRPEKLNDHKLYLASKSFVASHLTKIF